MSVLCSKKLPAGRQGVFFCCHPTLGNTRVHAKGNLRLYPEMGSSGKIVLI
jgi:hypothetical protein